MVFALSTSHEIGLAVVGAIFVIFSLLSSFYFPSRNPNFPGKKGLHWYVPLCFVFFAAQLASVFYFGQEKSEATAAPPAATSTAPTSSTSTSTTPAATGDATAGKAVFASAGCSACHTFAPAGSTGKVGPDLDHLADYAAKAGQPIEEYAHNAIEHPPPKYVPPGFPTNAMPTNFGQTLTAKQIDDLVAFITQS
jgi:mono/diheme cytochrome c family protein